MSKINARSPYYLEYVTPTKPSPEFTCAIANLSDYGIDTNGTVTLPTLDYGYIDSFTSTAGDFANNKFAPVGASSTRTVTFKIVIPNGFSNSGGGYLLCSKTAVQEAAGCVNGPTANGTIPTQSLSGAGDTNTIDLTSYFNAGTVAIEAYIIVNPHPSFVAMSRPTGTTLALTALNVGGTKVVYVKAIDSSPNSCVAIQAITVTVATNNDLGCTASTGVDSAGLTGGSIAQDGTISNPSLIGTIAEIRATSGGSAITSVAANTGSTAQDVTLYFLITVPTGYGNSGASIECSKTFSQSGTGAVAFDCDTTILTNQAIYTDGTIKTGNTSRGVIETTTPIKFEEVSTPTQRSITFNIRVPNSTAYSNANALVACTKSITQPAQLNPCSTSINTYYIQESFVGYTPESFCQESIGIGAGTPIASSANALDQAYNATVCNTAFGTNTALSPWAGDDRYWRVSKDRDTSSITTSSGTFYLWKISRSGIVTEVWRWNCDGGGDGNGIQL